MQNKGVEEEAIPVQEGEISGEEVEADLGALQETTQIMEKCLAILSQSPIEGVMFTHRPPKCRHLIAPHIQGATKATFISLLHIHHPIHLGQQNARNKFPNVKNKALKALKI